MYAQVLCVSVPSMDLTNGALRVPVSVQMTMMHLHDGENWLDARRFRAYRRGLGHLQCPYRITLRVDPTTPSSISRSMQRAAWFDKRVTWCGDEIKQGWSIFTPARYEDTDCRFEFCFEDEKEAVLFALRWKGET